MKKLFTSLSVIVAAMVTFSGCTKEEIKTPVSETKTVQFVAESIETKTAFGTPDGITYPTLWTENDEQVHVSMNLLSSKAYNITPSDDFKTARFEAEIADDESGSYTFYSVSPASANKSFSKDHKSYNLEIPITQTPSATSVDEKAQILVATSETYDEFPNSVNLAYTHFTAYGKMSLTNLNLDGAVVSSVAITASKNIAYRYYYYPASGTSQENGATSTITIMTSSVSDIWFACAPVDMSNSTMEVVVNTDRGTFTREITFPANRKFEAGKISIFSVNMAGISLESPEVYELVEDPAELTEGSKVIIVGDTYAMSTNQKTNNRAAEAVTFDKNTITTPGAGVQIFTIEEGTKAGTVAFNTGSGYIYAASSSSNHLKTQNGLDDNASWTVTISKGVTSVAAQGTNTRNTMRYNPNNGSPMFSCYESTSNTGSTVSIYKLQGSGTVLENYLKVSEENIEVEADATSASFTVKSDLEWTATSGDATVSVSYKTVTVEFLANEAEEKKTYTVTVSADGVDPVTVTITQKGYVDPSVIEELTVEEFLAKGVADNVWYKLTGTISNIANTTYGNFDLTDKTGTVYVYGLTKTQVESNDKSFSSIGLKEGDMVTLIGTRAVYNNSPQVGGPAYYVSHISACDAPVITCADNMVTIEAEEGATIYYTINGDEPTETSTKYTGAFAITETVTVKAIAVATEKANSVIVEKVCTYVNPNAGGNDPVVVFYESFASCTGTMGWSGSVANGTFKADDDAWVVENAFGADGAAKFGTGSKKGIATTPAFENSGNMTLTFKAGAWNSGSESTTLVLKIDNGGNLSASSVTLKKGEWTEYTITITDAVEQSTITFSGKNNSNSRFFLDDVKITKN